MEPPDPSNDDAFDPEVRLELPRNDDGDEEGRWDLAMKNVESIGITSRTYEDQKPTLPE